MKIRNLDAHGREVNNPAASNGASKLNAASSGVSDPRGTRQMSPAEPLGSLLAGMKSAASPHAPGATSRRRNLLCSIKIAAAVATPGQQQFIKHQKLRKLYIFWSRIIIFAAFLALWQIASDFGWIDKFYFSSPCQIGSLFIHDVRDKSLLSHIGITLFESGISFLLIILFSLLAATFFWFYPSLGKMFEPFLIVLNSLPKSALAPLIIVWLGTGLRTIILCGMSVGVFGCVLNLYQSFAQTDPERLKLIETLGGTKLQAFTKVVFPGNIPTFISLSKVNIGLALVGVIIGEFLAGRRGLGYLIIYGSQVFKLDMVILSITILCAIAMGIYGVLNFIENHYEP